MSALVIVKDIYFKYKEKEVLSGVSLQVKQGDFFTLVGPNGGGKSTLFRILSTLLKPNRGSVSIAGFDLIKDSAKIRKKLGVVFQTPALDKKLSVIENLKYQGYLFGISGSKLAAKTEILLQLLHLNDRKNHKVETLSGGLKRRLEIAKCMVSDPEILLLDEPTTGLDPLVRKEIWDSLDRIRKESSVTVLLSTHLLEEAEQASQIALIDHGEIVLSGSPRELKSMVSEDVLSLRSTHPLELKKLIQEKFSSLEEPQIIGDEVRIKHKAAHELIPTLVSAFSSNIFSVTLSKPTLEDLFIMKTGKKYHSSELGSAT